MDFMVTTAQRTTLDEFMALPEDGYRHELVRGEITCMPPPKGGHGRLELKLGAAIYNYLEERAAALGWREERATDSPDLLVGSARVGEVGVRFQLREGEPQVRGLDIAYFSPDQVTRFFDALENDYAPEMPVLVAEIISPSESAAYIEEKVRDCIVGGAKLIWLVFPRTRTVRIVTPDGISRTIGNGGTLDGGELLPGFSLKLSSLFS
jgi:Uma2 family endonuclease